MKDNKNEQKIKIILILIMIIFVIIMLIFLNNTKSNKTLKEYTVTIKSNGSNIKDTVLSCTTKDNFCKVNLPEIKREGYEIIGFSTKRNDTKKEYSSKEKIKINNDIILYAITKRKAEVTLIDKNDKNILSCDIYNEAEKCKVKLPNKEDISFRGWNNQASEKMIKYKPNEEVNISNDITLYSVYAREIFITFIKNGANAIERDKMHCFIEPNNDTCEIQLPNIIKYGWNILGFSNDKDSKVAKYKVKSKLTLKEDITLYAITKKEIEVTFSSNGSNVNIMSAYCTLFNDETSCKIQLPKIDRDDFDTLGFSENKDAKEATYKEETELEVNTKKTLYAITKKDITVTFNENKTTTETCTIYNTQKKCKVKQPPVTKDGYEFIGWGNINDTIPIYNNYPYLEVDKNENLYAITKKTITVTFTGEGNIEFDKKTCEIYNNDDSCNITIPNVDKLGYISYGFTTNPESKEKFPEYISNSNASFKKDTTLYSDFNTSTFNYRNINSKQIKYDSTIIEIENTCNKESTEKKIKNIYNNVPSLFKYKIKIMYLDDETYNSIHEEGNSIIFGPIPTKQFIDIKCNSDESELIKQLTYYYDEMYNISNGEYLSNSLDVRDLYTKYVNDENRPLNDTSYSNAKEFISDMSMYYYKIKYMNSMDYLPTDMKQFIEEKMKI